MTFNSAPALLEESLEGQVGTLLPQMDAWLTFVGIPHQSVPGLLSMAKESHGLSFEVVWEELPGILAGFVALLDPLAPAEQPSEAAELLESIEPIPPRYLEVASYWVDNERTPGLYLRLRMPLRFAPETAADALELISYMVEQHAAVLSGTGT